MELGRHLRLGAELGISLTAISALILAGCGGGGGGSAASGGSFAAALVTPMKGQFCTSAAVTVLDKNNQVIGTGSVNASGVVSVGSISSSAPAPYVVQVGAGSVPSCYYDEAAASNVTIPANTTALHAVVPSYAALTSASGLAVTPLTEMAYQYLNAAGTLAVVADVTAANNAVASGFGLTDILQTPTLIGPATTPLSNSTSQANRYALAIAALTQTAAASATGGQTTLEALLAQMPTFIASGVPATTYANAYSEFTGGASSVLATPAPASATAPTSPLASLIGGGAVSCNTSLFMGGVRDATAGELTSYARTYSGNTGTFDVNFNFVPDGTATLVLGASGTLTYNSAAQTVSSICYESAVPQLVVHYGSAGHVDLKTDGSFSGMGPDGTTAIKSGSLPVGTAPAAPTGVTATAASTSQIDLSWSAVSGAQGYRIYRSTTAGQAVTAMTDVLGGAVTVARSYSDSGLTAGTTYYYKIVAANSSGDSPASSEVSASTQSVAAVNRIPLMSRVQTGVGGLDYLASITAGEVAVLDGLSITGVVSATDPSSCTLSISNATMTLTTPAGSISASFSGDYNDYLDNNMGYASPHNNLKAWDGNTLWVSATLGANQTAMARSGATITTCKLPATPTLPADLLSIGTLADTTWATNKGLIVSATPYVGKGRWVQGLQSGFGDCSVSISDVDLRITVGTAGEVVVPLASSVGGFSQGASNWRPYFTGPFMAVKAPTLNFGGYNDTYLTGGGANPNASVDATVYYYYAKDGATNVTGVGEVLVRQRSAANIAAGLSTYDNSYVCIIKQAANGISW